MQRSFQPVMTAIVLTAAMLLACVPASADVIQHTDGGTYDYPPNDGSGDTVEAYNATTVNLLTGGTIGQHLRARDNSTVTVTGGTIGDDLASWNDSMVNVTGGTIGDDLYAWDHSTVTFSGGTIGDLLYLVNNSTLTIIGSGFNFAYGDYFDGGPLDGQILTGTLADETAFNNEVNIYDSATVTLAAPAVVPEPSSLVLGAIGALGLFAYGRRRRQMLAAA